MQRLAIRILSLALVAVSSATAVETKYPQGGFEPRLDKLQGLLDYVHTAKKIEVKAGPRLWRAIESIPVATDISITPAQEADLRDWLYDFLSRLLRLGQRQPRRPVLPARGRQQPHGLEEHAADLGELGHPPRRHAL